MEVNFDIVRIGKIRKNNISEKILQQNVSWLKESVRYLLSNNFSGNKINTINIVMVIPARGYSIKLVLQDLADKGIQKELIQNFSKNVYKGSYSDIIKNV